MAITTYNAHLREWENIIRIKLKVTNPALLKSGALGILANFLAGIKYDNLQYYNKTFQEMNVGLAQDFNSMLFHSSIYGTELKLATPPTLTSSLIIPELKLSTTGKITYLIPKNSVFTDNNKLPYIIESDITIETQVGKIIAKSWDKNLGSQKLSVTRSPNPNIPDSYLYLVSNNVAKQYQRSFTSVISTEYLLGDNFTFDIPITDISYIKEINVWVNKGKDQISTKDLDKMDSDDIENITSTTMDYDISKFKIQFQKFGAANIDKVIFLEIFETTLNFETGDGVHGIIIPPGSQIITEVQTTLGKKGNVNNSEFLIRNVQVTEIINTGNGNSSTNQYITSVNGLSTSGSTGGTSAQNTDELRETILDNINTRGSIITENDYEIAFKFNNIRPFIDAKFIDARSFVFLFNIIKWNDSVIPSTAVNVKEVDILLNPFFPTYHYGGYELVSPFYYKDASENTIDAYLLNPSVYIPWKKAPTTSIDANVYQVDTALTYDFTAGVNHGKSYIEILEGAVDEYIYTFSSAQFGASLILNKGNNFKMEIDDLYTDAYCVLLEPLKDMTLTVSDTGGNILATFVSQEETHPLVLKQTLYKYYQETGITLNGPAPHRTEYFNNSLNGIVSTSQDVVIGANPNFERVILRIPYYSKEYFDTLPANYIFDELDNYFMIDQHKEIINYNTQLCQTFHNTIDIPSKYYDYIFEKNNNGVLQHPVLPIELVVHINNKEFLSSPYGDLKDLEIRIKIFILNFLKNKEGFMVYYFESDLEKALWEEFSPLLRNIAIAAPLIFEVKNAALIYKGIQDNLTFNDMLEFVPPYFFYDYANINLKLEI